MFDMNMKKVLINKTKKADKKERIYVQNTTVNFYAISLIPQK